MKKEYICPQLDVVILGAEELMNVSPADEIISNIDDPWVPEDDPWTDEIPGGGAIDDDDSFQ